MEKWMKLINIENFAFREICHMLKMSTERGYSTNDNSEEEAQEVCILGAMNSHVVIFG